MREIETVRKKMGDRESSWQVQYVEGFRKNRESREDLGPCQWSRALWLWQYRKRQALGGWVWPLPFESQATFMVFVFCVNFPFVLLPQYLVVSAESRKATEEKKICPWRGLVCVCGGGWTALSSKLESLGEGDSRRHKVRAAHFSAF